MLEEKLETVESNDFSAGCPKCGCESIDFEYDFEGELIGQTCNNCGHSDMY